MKPKKIKGQESWGLKSDCVKLWITRLGGHLAPVEFRLGNRKITPYSIAPWAEEKLPTSTPNILRALRGDFFCMPFGDNATAWKGKKFPPHGETANNPWTLVSQIRTSNACALELSLRTKIQKGTVRKILHLRDGETAIYSRHILEGMTGAMSFGHHATLRFPPEEGSGHISMGPTAFGQVLPRALGNPAEGSYSSLKAGAEFHDLRHVPMADGSRTDLSRYPARAGYEDLVLLAAKPQSDFGWTTVTFPDEGYVWYALKDPRTLASTLLWISNGGRHFPPWNGRHRHVMGLEEITSYFHLGLAESCKRNSLNRRGIRTALPLDPREPLSVNYIMGVAAIPKGFDRVKKITRTPRGIVIHSFSGKKAAARVNADFLYGKG